MNVNEKMKISMFLSLSRLDWIYRGEGNENLVISLPEKKMILRMQKCDISSRQSIKKHKTKIIRDLQFFKSIMAPLIGKFVQTPLLIRITDKDVSELNDFLYQQRPTSRLNKKLFYTLITGQPDYTFLVPKNWRENWLNGLYYFDENPTFCIEIKPKQGWLPIIDRVNPKCTFCTNQYLKLMRKQVKSISKYCPQDFFSGNSYRMKRALKNLLTTPQNNLKIFKDGYLVYGEECCVDYIEIIQEMFELNNHDPERLVEKWAALLYKAITMRDEISFDENKENLISEETIHSCNWNKEPLPDNCVLQRILMAQKLQTASFEDTFKLYRERKQWESDYDYVDHLINNHELGDIERYLISATAKDCSLFIALKRRSKRYINESVMEMDGVSYEVSIGVGDLDPKPLSCIEKQRKRDSESLLAMLSYKHCKS